MQAYVLIWINRQWNIEFGHNSFREKDVNGILLEQTLHPHGGSVELTIPKDVRKTLDAIKSRWDGEVEIFVNKRNNVEMQSLT